MKSVTQHVISEVNIKYEFEKTNKGMLNIDVCTIKQLVQMKQILNKKSNSFWFSTVHMCKKESRCWQCHQQKRTTTEWGNNSTVRPTLPKVCVMCVCCFEMIGLKKSCQIYVKLLIHFSVQSL